MLGTQNDNLAGVITHDELLATARSIAALQLPNGMIPWFKDGHCDPWNHVETAMALEPHALGRYINEVDGEAAPGRVASCFTPQDWKRIAAVRQQYDPGGLFADYFAAG